MTAFRERVEAAQEAGTESEATASCLMRVMLTDTEMDDVEMSATMINALFAASESPAHVLAELFVHLADDAALQVELVEECFGPEATPLEDLTDQERMHMCLMEAMRCYSPVHLVQRAAKCDTQIAGARVPKGTTVLVCVRAVHGNEESHPEPKAFKVDRHEEELDMIMFQPDNPFCPFGASRPAPAPARQ